MPSAKPSSFALDQELLSPEANSKHYRRGQLYVMAGAPKVGKSLLAQEIARRLPGLWVIDTGDGWWSTAWNERSVEALLTDHFENGGVDVLLVVRTARPALSEPQLDPMRDQLVVQQANFIFIVEHLTKVFRYQLEGCDHLGWKWQCRHFLARHDVYKENWTWDSRMIGAEFWTQHVKPVCLDANDTLRNNL